MNVEMNGVGTRLIVTWSCTNCLKSSWVYSSGDFSFISEAKSPAMRFSFELIPIESMLDHLYKSDGTFGPVKSVFTGIAGRRGNLGMVLSIAFYTNT